MSKGTTYKRSNAWQAEAVKSSSEIYRQLIRTIPPLATHEELALGKVIVTSREARALFTSLRWTLTERSVLAFAFVIVVGHECASIIVEHNLRFIVSCACQYVGRGLDFEDLVQEGNVIAFRIALYEYDPKYGCRFNTLAGNWVKPGLKRAIAKRGPMMHLPERTIGLIDKMHGFEERYEKNEHCKPSDSDIAAHLGVSVDKVRELKVLAQPLQSLDAEVCDDEGSVCRRGDNVKDETSERRSDWETAQKKFVVMQLAMRIVADGASTRKMGEKMLESLAVVYGLCIHHPHSTREAGEILGVSGQAVSSRVNKARGILIESGFDPAEAFQEC